MMQNPHSVTHVTNLDISHFNVRCEKRRIQQRNISGRSVVRCANVYLIIHSSVEKNKDSARSVTENQPTDAQPNSFAFKVSECQSVAQNSLLVDCGATTHIVTDKSKFVRLYKISNPLVTVLNWQMALDQPDLCKVEVQPKSGCRV